MLLILEMMNFIASIIGGFFYWVVLPILVYIAIKILFFIFKICEARENKNYCRYYGYRGKRRWWD